VVFIHCHLLLSRGGLRENGDGYLTLEAKAHYKPSTVCYWWRYSNCSTSTDEGMKKKKKKRQKFIDYATPQ